MASVVLHADLDAFFASVEQRDDPALRGRPVAVGGGVITAASYEARAYGVHAAMGARKARALCPDLVVVHGRWEAYVEASKAVFAVFREAAPVVEACSIDEAYLDVTGLERICGPPEALAERLRRDVREQVGLPLSVGIASTKVLAKVAGGMAKPDGLLAVPAEDELWFLHGLPVERIPGVGPSTAERLRGRGIRTVGDAAAAGEATLVDVLGRARGRWLHAVAHNREPRRVRHGRARRSFGAQSAFRAGRSMAEVDRTAVALVDRVTRRMRRKGRIGRTVVLRLRFADFRRATRSCTLPAPTAETRAILAALRRLLAEAEPVIRARGLTLVGVAVTNLDHEPELEQLTLPVEHHDPRALDAAVDAVRERFGTTAIARGALLRAGRDLDPWSE